MYPVTGLLFGLALFTSPALGTYMFLYSHVTYLWCNLVHIYVHDFFPGLDCICGSHVIDAASAVVGDETLGEHERPVVAANSLLGGGHTSVADCPPNATDFPLPDDSGANLVLGTRQTDGICFKSVHRQRDEDGSGDKLKISYRCLPEHLLEPKERPFFCHASEAKRHEFKVGCCWDQDNCNLNLTVLLTSPPPSSPDKGASPFYLPSTSSQHGLVLVLLLTIPTGVAIVLLLVSVVVWRHYMLSGSGGGGKGRRLLLPMFVHHHHHHEVLQTSSSSTVSDIRRLGGGGAVGAGRGGGGGDSQVPLMMDDSSATTASQVNIAAITIIKPRLLKYGIKIYI